MGPLPGTLGCALRSVVGYSTSLSRPRTRFSRVATRGVLCCVYTFSTPYMGKLVSSRVGWTTYRGRGSKELSGVERIVVKSSFAFAEKGKEVNQDSKQMKPWRRKKA